MASSRMPFTANPDAPAAPDGQADARNPTSPGDPPSPEMEATAEALTREEVLRRRRRRAARLAGVYRRLYWALAEEVRARHRQYVWELGRSPLEAEQPPPPGGAVDAPRPGPAPVLRRKKCGFAGCKVRAMPMAKFCHSHILSDPNQKLYKGCAFVIKSGAQIGQIPCSRPILKASVPSLCNVHFQRTQKGIAQAYKKVGFNPSPTGRIFPNFSILVAECVRQIQAKRRESQSIASQKATWITQCALLLLDTRLPYGSLNIDCEEHLDPAGTGSFYNNGEADIVAQHVLDLVRCGLPPTAIAIQSPYIAQVQLLRHRLDEYPEASGVEVSTIDSFQGREADAVVISMVRSNSLGAVGFLGDSRRMNVAITRARRHVALVCDSSTICNNAFLARLLRHIRQHGQVRHVEPGSFNGDSGLGFNPPALPSIN